MKCSRKLVLLALGAAALGGCSTQSESTLGMRAELTTFVQGAPSAQAAFVNAKGWNVSVQDARMSVGPFYYHEGSVLLARHRAPGLGPWALRALGISEAWAHPGHYIAGEARGEMLSVVHDVQLQAGVVQLPGGQGTTGTVRSASFGFGALEPARVVVALRGRAQKGEQTRYFSASVKQEALLNASAAPRVDGCVFAGGDIAGAGAVHVEVRLPIWLDQVSFDELAEGTETEPTLIDAPMVAHNALVRGIKASDAYVFRYAQEAKK